MTIKTAGRVARRILPPALALALCGAALAQTQAQPQAAAQASFPAADAAAWAYPTNTPVTGPRPPRPDPAEKITVPGSKQTFTRGQFDGLNWVPDWFPNEHAAMPPIVASGRKPGIGACAYCHLPTGDGREENASINGLPKGYFISQVHQFKDGTRGVGVKGPTAIMVSLSKLLTDEEIEAAAAYFAGQPHRSATKVVESKTSPKARAAGNVYFALPGKESEPLGARVMEMTSEDARFELRDNHTPYTAYVPVGSIKAGDKLAHKWGPDGSLACTTCHGKDLKGVGDVPPLAGRSPTYIARQLIDFQNGSRGGPQAAPMAMVTQSMKNDDIVALSAYIASRKP